MTTIMIPWGSIIRGHLLELDTTIPLSMEKESTGNPAICHALILTGSPSVALREKLAEQRIFLSLHIFSQSAMHSYMHKGNTTQTPSLETAHVSEVNSECSKICHYTSWQQYISSDVKISKRYAILYHKSLRIYYRSPSTLAASPHRSFSPPRPPISFSALSSFLEQRSMFCSRPIFLVWLASNSSLSNWSLSNTC